MIEVYCVVHNFILNPVNLLCAKNNILSLRNFVENFYSCSYLLITFVRLPSFFCLLCTASTLKTFEPPQKKNIQLKKLFFYSKEMTEVTSRENLFVNNTTFASSM